MARSPGNEPSSACFDASTVTSGLLARIGPGSLRSPAPAPRKNPVQTSGLPFGCLLVPLVGDPDRDQACRQRVGVLVPIALKRDAPGVKRPAVELDEHPLGTEERVELMLAEADVHLRRRQTVAPAEGGKASLEVGPGGAFRGDAEHLPELGGAPVVRMAADDVDHVIQLEPMLKAAVVDGAIDRLRPHSWRHVEEGSRQRGYGDAVVTRDVSSVKFVAVDAHASWTPISPHRDIQRPLPPPPDPPQGERRAVAQHGAVAACEDGGHGVLVRRYGRLSNCVDGAMSSVETADLDSMVDACVVQADRQQLLARDIPPLAR